MIRPRFAGLAFLFASVNLVPYLAAQSPDAPLVEADSASLRRAATVWIDLGAGDLLRPPRQKARFEEVGLKPRHHIGVILQYPLTMAGQTMIVEPLDGGEILVRGDTLVIDQEGYLSFAFRAGENPGHYRVSVHQEEEPQILQFWVRDRKHPENDPELLPGS